MIICIVCVVLGLGGGFCDRDNVEYVDRNESDDEFDEVWYNVLL